ncbi:HET-domain-containing protein [Apiospora rasikravindrae]|uniref:HET-domain-containing protein n=1 Tax=Apiospora rasikravindrae TaxID=990691 RepID=A0ABR1RSF3_9PEZI
MEVEPQVWLDSILDPFNLPSSPPFCAVCEKLFDSYYERHPVMWPSCKNVEASGKETCARCRLVYTGVSAVLPSIQTWDHAQLYGRLMIKGYHIKVTEDTFLQVGVYGCDPGPSEHQPIIWIDFQVNPHDGVGRSTLPKRIIDLELKEGAGLDVVLRDPGHHDNAPYIALSYCWGNGQNLTTTKDTLDSHRTRIRWDELPTLFRDVIEIGRALSLRFLWIDALCIIQDDEEDWKQEAQKMAAYYSNAWLTIAADHAPGVGHTPLPAKRSPAMRLEGDFAADGATILVHRLPIHFEMEDDSFHNTPSPLPLFTRAWALQERLLSRRTLHLGPEEAMWECCSAYWCECGRPIDRLGYPGFNDRPLRQAHHNALRFPAPMQRLYDHWNTVLGKYLARELSFENDRLKAITSLAKDFKATDEMLVTSAAENGRPQLGDYVYGLWTATLPGALIWDLYSYNNGNSRNCNFPTWSWASVTGVRNLHRLTVYRFVPEATVREVPVESWDIDSQNRPTDVPPPCIVLEGLAVKKKCHYVDGPRWLLLNPNNVCQGWHQEYSFLRRGFSLVKAE